MEELFSATGGVVCLCKDITYTQIKEAMAEGATTIEDIMDKTEAGTVCGNCRKHIRMILNEEGDAFL